MHAAHKMQACYASPPKQNSLPSLMREELGERDAVDARGGEVLAQADELQS